MPNTKSSDIRFKVLDRCLKRGGYSTEGLLNVVNEELENQGYPKVTSLNTIRKDLEHIGGSAYPDINIISTRKGRNITYSYDDPESSIYNVQFNDEEIAQLTQCMTILSRFEGTPQMEWMQSFLERARLTVDINIEGKQVVGFDECRYLKGKEFFAPLLASICKKEVLSIGYQNFKSDSIKEILIHPYYLKEFNNRWFLIGLSHGYDSITNLAFDRIEYINKVSGVTYIENISYDFNDDYFSDIIGVSKDPKTEPIDVILWVAKKEYPYIRTKPLHESQHKIEVLEDGYKIGLKVCPNYELEQLLLSYGEGISVLEPLALRDKLRGRISDLLKKYDRFN